jgi:hypothetical protein
MAPAFAAIFEALLPLVQNLLGLAANHVAQGNHDAANTALAAAIQVGQIATQVVGPALLPPAPAPADPAPKA